MASDLPLHAWKPVWDSVHRVGGCLGLDATPAGRDLVDAIVRLHASGVTEYQACLVAKLIDATRRA